MFVVEPWNYYVSKLQHPDRAPDVGPLLVHEKAGAIAVGARPFSSRSMSFSEVQIYRLARQIAGAIRARNGWFTVPEGLGFSIAHAQSGSVSMNLVNYEVTGITEAYLAGST